MNENVLFGFFNVGIEQALGLLSLAGYLIMVASFVAAFYNFGCRKTALRRRKLGQVTLFLAIYSLFAMLGFNNIVMLFVFLVIAMAMFLREGVQKYFYTVALPLAAALELLANVLHWLSSNNYGTIMRITAGGSIIVIALAVHAYWLEMKGEKNEEN